MTFTVMLYLCLGHHMLVGFSMNPAREYDHILLEGKSTRSLNWVSLFASRTESSRNDSSSGPALEGILAAKNGKRCSKGSDFRYCWGTALLISGHPFDTIKVKLQSQPVPRPGQQPRYAGAMDAVKQTITKDGLRGLYKGMGAPLATVAACNAVLFTARGQMEALFRVEPGLPLSVGQQVVCGAGAGFAVSFLTCPTELIKCRLQAQSALATASVATLGVTGVSASIKHDGPIDVAKHVLRYEGARRLFKGLIPTLSRDVPGYAISFGVYEALKQFMAGGHDTSELGMGALLTSGGIAGAATWALIYPTDVVKSVIQIDEFHQPKYSGTIDAFKKMATSEGFKGLYKGYGPAMARSVPANAACFLAYEVTRSILG